MTTRTMSRTQPEQNKWGTTAAPLVYAARSAVCQRVCRFLIRRESSASRSHLSLFALSDLSPDMDTYTEQPAPASNFYGTQKQPRLKLDTKRRTPTSGIPSSSNRSPFSPFTGHNSFLKRQHSPIRSYGMSHALRDVKNTGDHVRPVRTGTPHPEATRTWGQARRESLSVEKKLKSFSIESETRKSNASEDVFPIKNGIRHNYGRRSSAGQQSALVPRGKSVWRECTCHSKARIAGSLRSLSHSLILCRAFLV